MSTVAVSPIAKVERLLRYKKLVVLPPLVAAALYVYFLRAYSSRRREGAASGTDKSGKPAKSTGSRARVGVNRRFFAQMRKLLPILVPGALEPRCRCR